MKFYVDTSVWGGYEDEEFSAFTKPFIEQARQGKFTLVISDVTIGELNKAPKKKSGFFHLAYHLNFLKWLLFQKNSFRLQTNML